MAKKAKPTDTGVKIIKYSYADLEAENRLIRAQLEQRDQRIIELAQTRDNEITRRHQAEASARTAENEIKSSRENNAHLKDVLVQAQLDVANLQGYRDRVREQDRENRGPAPVIMGLDLARGSDRSEEYAVTRSRRDTDWINRL